MRGAVLGRKKSPDGWYDLSEVESSETLIRGQASYGGLLSGKHRLTIDRLTGDVRFGSVEERCEKTATGPTERKL